MSYDFAIVNWDDNPISRKYIRSEDENNNCGKLISESLKSLHSQLPDNTEPYQEWDAGEVIITIVHKFTYDITDVIQKLKSIENK